MLPVGHPYIVNSFYLSPISVVRLSLYLPHDLLYSIISIVYSTLLFNLPRYAFIGCYTLFKHIRTPQRERPQRGATDKSKLESRFDSKVGTQQNHPVLHIPWSQWCRNSRKIHHGFFVLGRDFILEGRDSYLISNGNNHLWAIHVREFSCICGLACPRLWIITVRCVRSRVEFVDLKLGWYKFQMILICLKSSSMQHLRQNICVYNLYIYIHM